MTNIIVKFLINPISYSRSVGRERSIELRYIPQIARNITKITRDEFYVINTYSELVRVR